MIKILNSYKFFWYHLVMSSHFWRIYHFFYKNPNTNQKFLHLLIQSFLQQVLSVRLIFFLANQNLKDQILIYAAKTYEEIIFREELDALAREGLQVIYVNSQSNREGSARRGRIDEVLIETVCTDIADREVYVAGAYGFVGDMEKLAINAGAVAQHITVEQFNNNLAAADNADIQNATATVTFSQSHKVQDTAGAMSLLEAAEAAGLKPVHGCRRGICGTCKCYKKSGVVLNIITGEKHVESDQLINLCISVPVGEVEMIL